jgi:hypothetical protein
MQQSLKIDSGEVRLAIEDENGNIKGEIKFNPKDELFAERFYRVMKEFQQKMQESEERSKELDSNTKLDENGLPVNIEEGMVFLRETCSYMREKIDYLFGSGTSQIVFGDVLSFDMIAQFLDGVTPYIQTARSNKLEQYIPNKPTKPQFQNVKKARKSSGRKRK